MAINTHSYSKLFISILKTIHFCTFLCYIFSRTEFSSFHMRMSSVIVPQKSRNDRYRFSPISQTCQKTLDCFHMNCS